MKNVTYLICFLIFGLGITACQTESLADLAEMAGKTPAEAEFFQNTLLQDRLVALMGKDNYRQMIEDWQTQTPIEDQSGILHTSGCQNNNCDEVGHHVFIDVKGNNINVYSFRDGKVTEYMEKGEIPLPDQMAEDFKNAMQSFMKPKVVDPDPTDDIPAGEYIASTADPAIAEKIGGFLRENLIPAEEVELLGERDQRRFNYDQYDLDGDGRNEYLVGLENTLYCGTGGCTYFLLHPDGEVITRFSVAKAPFLVLASKSNGWHDLAVRSGGALRTLTYNGKTYPSNPSTLKIFRGEPSDAQAQLLGFERPIPKFSF